MVVHTCDPTPREQGRKVMELDTGRGYSETISKTTTLRQ